MWIPFPSGAAHPVRRIGLFWWERFWTFWRFGCLGFGTSWLLRDPLTPILYYVLGVGTLYPANPGSHYRECASTSTSRVGAVWPHDGGGRYSIFYISCFTGAVRPDYRGRQDRECASICFVGVVWPHDGGGHYRKFIIAVLQVLRGMMMEEATIANVRVPVL